MMEHNTTHPNGANPQARMTTALRDGLIAMGGLAIAAGSLLNAEITMWWLGA